MEPVAHLMPLILPASGPAPAKSDFVALHVTVHALSAQIIAQATVFAKEQIVSASQVSRGLIALGSRPLKHAQITAPGMVVAAKSMVNFNVCAKRVTPGSHVCWRILPALTTAAGRESACQMANAYVFLGLTVFLAQSLLETVSPATTARRMACALMVCANVFRGSEGRTAHSHATLVALEMLGATPTSFMEFVSTEAVCARRVNGRALDAKFRQTQPQFRRSSRQAIRSVS